MADLKGFFLLAIFNHKEKLYNFRLENGRGDPGSGSRHSIISYVAQMAASMEKVKSGEYKSHWRHSLWEGVLEDPANVEQVVLAHVPAKDHSEAADQIHQARAQLIQCYEAMGYRRFDQPSGKGEPPAED
jgi:hypothetical protein